MAQNSKTIRIIFLPKCTQKNCAFYAAFYMFFLRISVVSGKTKSALAAVFCENSHEGGHRFSGRKDVEILMPPAI